MTATQKHQQKLEENVDINYSQDVQNDNTRSPNLKQIGTKFNIRWFSKPVTLKIHNDKNKTTEKRKFENGTYKIATHFTLVAILSLSMYELTKPKLHKEKTIKKICEHALEHKTLF